MFESSLSLSPNGTVTSSLHATLFRRFAGHVSAFRKPQYSCALVGFPGFEKQSLLQNVQNVTIAVKHYKEQAKLNVLFVGIICSGVNEITLQPIDSFVFRQHERVFKCTPESIDLQERSKQRLFCCKVIYVW